MVAAPIVAASKRLARGSLRTGSAFVFPDWRGFGASASDIWSNNATQVPECNPRNQLSKRLKHGARCAMAHAGTKSAAIDGSLIRPYRARASRPVRRHQLQVKPRVLLRMAARREKCRTHLSAALSMASIQRRIRGTVRRRPRRRLRGHCELTQHQVSCGRCDRCCHRVRRHERQRERHVDFTHRHVHSGASRACAGGRRFSSGARRRTHRAGSQPRHAA